MTLSLITICYNSARTLKRTVESVLKQTRLPEEYVFVDGGSTDGTLELLKTLTAALQEHGIGTQVIPQVRTPGEAGIPSAWNQGLKQVSGDIIGLLNSDDWYETDALEQIENTAAAQPAAGLISGGTRFVSPQGTEVKIFRPGKLSELPWRMPIPHPSTFVRRETYQRIGYYDVTRRISADYDFVWRCHVAQVPLAVSEGVITNMELGGLANSSRALARRETREIACRHGGVVIPWLAWLARTVTGR